MSFRVQTEELAARERFAYWQDMVAQLAMPVVVRSQYAANFDATVHTALFGRLQTFSMSNPSMELDRTRIMIRRSDPEVYHIALNLSGNQHLSQDRREVVFGPGDMTLYHSSRPFHTRADARISREAAVVLAIPHDVLPLPPDKVRALLAVRLSGRDGVGALVARYLQTLANEAYEFHPADAARLSFITLDLVSVMLARHLDLQTVLPAEARETALLAAIQSFIHHHLGNPRLNPEMIAAAHHLSLRALHRLFQRNQTTIAGWIRGRRLDRCRSDLTDPTMAGQSVRTIAARWGLLDPSQFSRAFKAAYGVNPTAYRELHRATRDGQASVAQVRPPS